MTGKSPGIAQRRLLSKYRASLLVTHGKGEEEVVQALTLSLSLQRCFNNGGRSLNRQTVWVTGISFL